MKFKGLLLLSEQLMIVFKRSRVVSSSAFLLFETARVDERALVKRRWSEHIRADSSGIHESQ